MALALQIVLLGVWDRIDRGRRAARLPVAMEPRSGPAPDLVVERADGTALRIPARSGRYQLVHFWATWCPPCRTELPALLDMARRNESRLDVWAISADPEWGAVRKFLGGGVHAPVVRDPTGAGSKAFDVTTLPDSYLIGPDGRVRARFPGAQGWTSAKMVRVLNRLMRGS